MNIKSIVNKYPKINIEKIKQKIDQYSIISFDIFDTLIKRDVQSEHDVFDLTEKLFNNKNEIKIIDYRTVRKRAEEKARLSTTTEEITIELLKEALMGEKDRKGYAITPDNAESLINCEREIERNICVRNELLYPIYQYCVNARKRIIIISDMYWEKEFLVELLQGNGFDRYDSIYVSSEYGRQKRSGQLYDVVVEKENVSGASILHIGDNKKADFISAIKAGLKAISIPKIVDSTKYARRVENNSFGWKCCEKFINNRLLVQMTKYERIGYEVYGPLLYTFVNWLAEKLDSDKTTLFFARDCYVVKPALEMYTGQQTDKNVYFLGSRRSLIIPALSNGADLERVALLIKSEARKMTISGLLRKLGVENTEYTDRLKKYGLTENTVIDRDNLQENTAFVAFYETIKSDIEENAKKEYGAFIKYWDSLNCTKELQIVDIGWRGTMQYCLENLLDEAYEIKGYYLGIRKDATIEMYEDIFLNGKEDFEKECFLAGITALIEIFFSAPHGSVKRYMGEGEIEYLPYECEKEKASEQFVVGLHQGAMQFVKDYSESILSKLAKIHPEIMFSVLYYMGTKPQKEELKSFGRYPFQTGAGVVKTVEAKWLLRYIRKPKDFIYDFSNSNWKVGFLSECMKMRIPYYPLFKWIYKHRG